MKNYFFREKSNETKVREFSFLQIGKSEITPFVFH